MGIEELTMDYTPNIPYINLKEIYDTGKQKLEVHFTQLMRYVGVLFANIYGGDVEMDGGNIRGYTIPNQKKITLSEKLDAAEQNVVAKHELDHNGDPSRPELANRYHAAQKSKELWGHARSHEPYYST